MMNKKHINDDDEAQEIIISTLGREQYLAKLRINTVYHLDLGDDVKGPDDYTDLRCMLEYDVKAEDTIIHHLANSGGTLRGCLTLINAIKKCKGRIETKVDADCYSAGAVLALVGHSLEMRPGTFLMFHNYSGMRWGKGAESTMMTEAINEQYKYMLNTFCRPFLTDAEVNKIVNDGDVYIHASHTSTEARIKRHFK